MAWAEEQWWFGLEDLVIEQKEAENYAFQLLFNHNLWLGKGGEQTYNLKDMNETHIKNCIKMIKEGRLNRDWAIPVFENELKRRKNDS